MKVRRTLPRTALSIAAVVTIAALIALVPGHGGRAQEGAPPPINDSFSQPIRLEAPISPLGDTLTGAFWAMAGRARPARGIREA